MVVLAYLRPYSTLYSVLRSVRTCIRAWAALTRWGSPWLTQVHETSMWTHFVTGFHADVLFLERNVPASNLS